MRWQKQWTIGFALGCLVSAPALGRDGGIKEKAPTISMPSFGEIPKAEGLKPPQVERLDQQPTASELHFSVVKIEHAKSFRSSSSGRLPIGDRLASISLSGSPPATEKCRPLGRIKAPAQMAAQIQIRLRHRRRT